jgi:hypothetical protein
MDNKERYRRDRDLKFQEIEEKPVLQKQAISGGARGHAGSQDQGITTTTEPSVGRNRVSAGTEHRR